MRRIGPSDTTPEIRLRRLLHGKGLRFRLHVKALPGTPDIVLPRHRTVIFVHGCYWHRHKNCKRAFTPATNRDFWVDKFARNVSRDAKVQRALRRLGWRVLVVWECQLGNKTISSVARRITRAFNL